jgi:hypothetical protein
MILGKRPGASQLTLGVDSQYVFARKDATACHAVRYRTT